jgi:hypothetical protein
MSKIFELIRPKSLLHPDYEQFEYLIRWIGRDGADYLYMFYDAQIRKKINGNIINRDNAEQIETIISSSQETIELTADDISRNDLPVFLEMLENKYVQRLKKDGTTERFALDENSFDYRLKDGRYELDIKLIAANKKVWN